MHYLKVTEYYDFVKWTATPIDFRFPKFQKDFSHKHNISHTTLTTWKNDPNFWEDVKRVITSWAKDYTANVINSLYMKAVESNVRAIKLWLEWTGEMAQFQQENQGNAQTSQSFFGRCRREDKQGSRGEVASAVVR